MKRIKLCIAGLCILLAHLSSSAEQDGACKDGVCPVILDKPQPAIPKEKQAEHSSVLELTNQNFDSIIKNSTKPVIVDFYAVWCGPCKMMKPLFAELAVTEKEYIFAAIEGDKHPTISAQCKVNAFPSFVVFKNGVQWGKIEGGKPKEDLLNAIKKIVATAQPQKK